MKPWKQLRLGLPDTLPLQFSNPSDLVLCLEKESVRSVPASAVIAEGRGPARAHSTFRLGQRCQLCCVISE